MNYRHLFLLLLIFSCASITNAQSWKNYPYHQAGSVLTFPNDEGYHPGEVIEWWYTNAHVTGDSTGTDYSLMLTYFYYPTLGYNGFRILELSNENTGQFATETTPCNYPTLAQDHLEISATTGFAGTGHEEWKTLKDSLGNLIPFQYQISSNMAADSIDLTYNSVKRPLMVGGTGFLYEGITGYTYYYSETQLQVTGTITMNGVTETVHGIAWVDRQWGQFNPNNGEKYTWMSLQLSNGQDLNLWNIFNTANQIPDTSTYRFCTLYMNDSTQTTMSNFTLERLKYKYTYDSLRCYDQKWRLTYGNTDLILTATHSNNEVTVPFRFFEGSMLITGTVDGIAVNGVGYVELLHSFSNPDVIFTSPLGHTNWSGTTPVTWHLNNPDDGRPVYYDLALSTDNKVTFNPIANHLTDTSYSWTPNLNDGDEGWFSLISYSIDTTLNSKVISDTSFVYFTTGIKEIIQTVSVSANPNPVIDQLNLIYNLSKRSRAQLDILNEAGQVIRHFNPLFQSPGENLLTWNTQGISSGVYFYRLRIDEHLISGKFIKGELR